MGPDAPAAASPDHDKTEKPANDDDDDEDEFADIALRVPRLKRHSCQESIQDNEDFNMDKIGRCVMSFLGSNVS